MVEADGPKAGRFWVISEHDRPLARCLLSPNSGYALAIDQRLLRAKSGHSSAGMKAVFPLGFRQIYGSRNDGPATE